jgi:hypothetical protein
VLGLHARGLGARRLDLPLETLDSVLLGAECLGKLIVHRGLTGLGGRNQLLSIGELAARSAGVLTGKSLGFGLDATGLGKLLFSNLALALSLRFFF